MTDNDAAAGALSVTVEIKEIIVWSGNPRTDGCHEFNFPQERREDGFDVTVEKNCGR
jgi:hypothetical protein